MVCQGGDNLDRAAALPGSCAIIERFEFDTRISRGETPINGGLSVIPLLLPSTNSLLCLLKAGDSSSQALSSQHREFNFCHI